MHRLIRIISLLQFATLFSCVTTESSNSSLVTESPWTYDETDEWSTLSRGNILCQLGSRRSEQQSPLDLPRAADLPAAGQKLKISYPPTVSGILWSKKIDAPSLGIDFATGKSGHITLNGQRFDLISLRVHIPSEHIIEGREFAGELQLEHRSKAGKIAIISTFFDFGEPKPDFILQLKKLNDTPGRPASHFEPMQFIPSSQNHYVYNGSLTNPPCTEGVNWLIFPKPLPIDTRTLGYLRELLGGHANARRHYSLPPPYVPLRNANHALSFESR